MRELKARRQMLALGVDPFEAGDRFQVWPLHITLVPWFTNTQNRQLAKELRELANCTRPIVAKIGERALFGTKRTTPVELIEPNKAIHQLHLEVLSLVHKVHGVVEDASTISYKYTPHVTNRKELELAESYVLDNLLLVNDVDSHTRQIAETFKLQG